MTEPTTLKRCAIYARASGDVEGAADSIDEQLQRCREYAARQEWLIVAAFHDVASSSIRVEDRPGYYDFLADAIPPERAFDIVLVADLTRLMRTNVHLDALRTRLGKRGIEVVCVADADRRRPGAAGSPRGSQ